ncbi:MAG: type II toxin-antitoxin system RelE/ParE family toxin [Lachnospiraceae bacterium]|nr:type II toxin-antitoxin system RelE/ParE family toxin [Lachnospiraceae bacterium]
MTEINIVSYSGEALDDLRDIYTYIANELLVPETAAAQVGRIRKKIRSLDFMPARYALVEWEPWHSMGMHQLPVDNFIVYYLVDDVAGIVTVVRVFYGGCDIEEIINSK